MGSVEQDRNTPGFLLVAMRSDLDLSPPSQRPAIIARVQSIRTRAQAHAYIEDLCGSRGGRGGKQIPDYAAEGARSRNTFLIGRKHCSHGRDAVAETMAPRPAAQLAIDKTTLGAARRAPSAIEAVTLVLSASSFIRCRNIVFGGEIVRLRQV